MAEFSEVNLEEELSVETLFEAEEEVSSSVDPPMSEWSSLRAIVVEENEKKILYSQGLYSPGSGEICARYISMSDSTVLNHPHYDYPAVVDPGIEEALLGPELPTIYPDDGQALYLKLCSELNQCPVRIFHRGLLKSDINLSYYGIDPRGVLAMAKALHYNAHVTCLNLTSNFLTDDSCFHLGEMLKHNKTLKELILTDCRIGASGVLRLMNNIRSNKTLITLDLEGNKLGDKGGEHFGEALDFGVYFKEVNLRNNSLGAQTTLALKEAFEWRNTLTHLDLSFNKFCNMKLVANMLEMLADSKVLEVLNLSYTALESERVGQALQDMLLVPTLRVLDLSHNRLRDEEVSIMAKELRKAKNLEILNLSYNPLSPEGAYATLKRMLRIRVKLQKLFMEGVDVQKEFLDLLERVKKMKCRQNFVIMYGHVLQNWEVEGPDIRDVILKRADYFGTTVKENIDVPVYFLSLNKEVSRPMAVKDLVERFKTDNVPLKEEFTTEMSFAFPGPVVQKVRSVDLEAVCEYIARLWPDKKPPPTPLPTPPTEPTQHKRKTVNKKKKVSK